jgi:molybdopterin converting factor small subunit
MARISVYYWAGAKAAAGVELDSFDTDSVAEALELARRARNDPRFDRVLSISSVLVDGSVVRGADLEQQVAGDVRVEILPPFAGGGG